MSPTTIRARYARTGTPKLLWQEVVIDVGALCDEVDRLTTELAALRGTDPYREDRIDLDDAGELDDVAIAASRFRLERMAEGAWWMSVERPGKSNLVVNLSTKRPARTAITASFYEDGE